MTMMVVLFPSSDVEAFLSPSRLRLLSDLGVTDVCLVRDEDTVGVVLEGWAFDPARSAQEAADIVAGDRVGCRTMLPVMQAAVSPYEKQGAES